MPRVVIEQLRKTFPLTKGRSVCAVNDLNLTVEAGEFLVLVGPSGSGKTTTLRLLAGLEDVTAGTVSIDGRVMNQVPAKDRDLAMVFQHHALYPHMTVYENLAFGLTLRHVPKTEIDRRVQEAARWLDLLPLLTRKPAALSGGQRQRVAVGRAVVRQAGVLLFDEPLSNLDAPLRATLRAEISRLHRRLGTTTIYVTHDQVEAMTLGDRIAVMHEGTLQQIATPMELYARPANLFVARFFGSPPMNLFQGTLRRDGAAWHFAADDSAGKFQLPISHTHTERLARHVGQAVVVGLRPEHFLKPTANNLLPENIQLTATVELVERTGAETHLHLALGTNLFVARVAADEPVKVNQIISLTVDMEKALFFEATTGAVIP